MEKFDELFSDPLKYSILDRTTPFARNLKTLILSRMGEGNNHCMPYRLKRTGGQYLEVVNERKNYSCYENEALYTKGCNWNYVHGATSVDSYAYANCFDYSVSYFALIAQFYLGLLEYGDYSFEDLINGTAEDREDFLGNLYFVCCGESIREELLESMDISSIEEAEDLASLTLILSSAYIHYYFCGMTFPKEWRQQLCEIYQQMVLLGLEMDDKIGLSIPPDISKLEKEYKEMEKGYIMEYLDYFMDYLEDYFNKESNSVYPDFMPMLMSVLFSFQVDEEGCQAHLYMYSSKELKEYKDLREKYPDSSYVERMDKMLPLLLDPAGKKETAYGGFNIPFGENEKGAVCMEYGYYDEEYICCYMSFNEENMSIPRAFPMVMSYFHHLLNEFKKEVEFDGGKMVKTA